MSKISFYKIILLEAEDRQHYSGGKDGCPYVGTGHLHG